MNYFDDVESVRLIKGVEEQKATRVVDKDSSKRERESI